MVAARRVREATLEAQFKRAERRVAKLEGQRHRLGDTYLAGAFELDEFKNRQDKLNHAFFNKVFIDADQVVGAIYAEPFAQILTADLENEISDPNLSKETSRGRGSNKLRVAGVEYSNVTENTSKRFICYNLLDE